MIIMSSFPFIDHNTPAKKWIHKIISNFNIEKHRIQNNLTQKYPLKMI